MKVTDENGVPMSSQKEICIEAAKKVFDNRSDVESIAQGYIESAIDRFNQNSNEIPAHVLANIAASAAWFVYDNNILGQTLIPLVERRELVAEHLRKRFPLYATQ
jgi:hypothetical protein